MYEFFITAEEASRKWGIGLRTVQRMCANGIIEGVEKISNIWMIPNTAKPHSQRKTKHSVTKEEILDAYKAFVCGDYNKYNKNRVAAFKARQLRKGYS